MKRRAKPVAAPRRQGRRGVSAADLNGLSFIGAGCLSPDGASYAFSVRTARQDLKGYDSHIHVVGTGDGRRRQFTFGRRSDSGPVFSPDGAWIAFLGRRGRYPGIHLIPSDGGEARTLVEKDGDFADLSFSPDGARILCTFRPNDPDPARAAASRAEAEGSGPGGRAGEAPADRHAAETALTHAGEATDAKREAPVYRHIDRLFYRLDGRGFLPRAEPQVWTFEVAGGRGRQITRGRRMAVSPSFSPDGKRIVFMSNIRRDPDLERELTDLFVVPATGGRPRLIPTPPGPVYCPRFSPDGRWIAYLGHDDTSALWYENVRVWVVAASGRGRARCLCPEFDQHAYDSTIGDMADVHFSLTPVWSPDGRHIYFVSSRHGETALYRVALSGGAPARVTPGRQHLMSISLAPLRRLGVGTVSRPTLPPEVFAYDLRTGRGKRLTRLNRDWATRLELRQPRRVRVRSTEKAWVEAWILTPPGFSPRRRYPAIVEVHGGPQTQYGYTFFHELQLLAARGFVVLYSNPRGSTGYGRAFAEAIRGAWGGRDFADVMAVTDYLAALPYVDEARIGITGGSYGGYMTNWAIGHTRRYRAAVTQRSLADLVPFFGSSDVGFDFKHSFNAHPWEDPEGFRRQSPLTYAPRIRTPLLIIHSENDQRCGIEQAENLFATLKVLKRRVEMVRFPEESHGLSRGGRPDRRQARLEKIVAWFERYL